MASCKVEEQEGEAKHLALACEHLNTCSLQDPQEDCLPDPSPPTAPSPRPQTPGKLRRTALRFFGVRKSICLLPAIFGGRNKNHTKKRFGKSKTHDGLSKASCDDSPGSEGASGGSFTLLGQREGAQRSSQGDYSSFPAAEHKSQSFPRQKKGLRGLFNSIRLHRTQRNAEVESNEMTTLSSSVSLKEVPVAVAAVVQEAANQNECLGVSPSPEMPAGTALSDAAITPECNHLNETERGPLGGQVPDDRVDQNTSTVAVSVDYSEGSIAPCESSPQLQAALEAEAEPSAGPPPAVSSDQLHLIFEDVASLKSFDSLTGCGDIIADQDDDSLAESTVSGERSRSAGKRSSCCLTYQGGGEEMASPDGLEADGLRHLWGGTPEDDAFCSSCTEEPTTSDLTGSQCCAQPSSTTDASTLTPDELTPQSEHPGSVPNSDEGYYDATTPGAEDPQDKLEHRMGQTDRIPRDSYSGDALYELFVPEESLISPRYEDGPELGGSESCGYGLGSEGMADSAFLPDINPLGMDSNLYEDKDFQNAFDAVLCNQSKEFAPFSKSFSGSHPQENANLNLKAQEFFNNNNRINLDSAHENGNLLESTERRIQTINTDSFGSLADPDFTRFSPTFAETTDCPNENTAVSSLYGHGREDEGQTVCFSQALVDYTKHSQFLRDNLDPRSSLSPSMEALPTIVTFDVMDMHNEGEYDDQQLQEGLEDGATPYPDFREGFLQKEASAECDYQMLNSMYGHNLFGNAWAVASLPRHLGLTRGGPASGTGPSPPDRRSRSLDREGLERGSSQYPGSAAAGPLSPHANVHSSALLQAQGGGAGGDFQSLPWSTEALGRSTASDNRSVKAGPSQQGDPRDAQVGARHCGRSLQPGESGPPYGSFALPDSRRSNVKARVSASVDSEGDVCYPHTFNVQTFNPFGKR